MIFKRNKNKEKQIKKSGIVVVSADKAIVRNSTFDKETEVSKTAILICYHLIDYLAYICLILGVMLFFVIPIVGLFIVLLSKILFDIGNQYKKRPCSVSFSLHLRMTLHLSSCILP